MGEIFILGLYRLNKSQVEMIFFLFQIRWFIKKTLPIIKIGLEQKFRKTLLLCSQFPALM